MLGLKVVEYLEDIGVCQRCILIYLGERSDLLYVNLTEIGKAISEASINLTKEVQCSPNSETLENMEQHSTVSTETNGNNMFADRISEHEAGKSGSTTNGILEPPSKQQKCSVCITCIGFLQHGCSLTTITELSDALTSNNHDADAFTLALALPICLNLRIHRVWTLLKKSFPQIPDKGREDHISTVKDVWKNLVGPKLEKAVNKTFVQGQYLEFIMNVSTSYVNDIEDCKILDQLCESMFSVRRKQHKKYSSGVYSKQSVDAAIKKVKDGQFLEVCPHPPSIPIESVKFTDLKWQRESIYMAGRYNKYSRELSQTPWFVDEERKMESSVQELLCEIINKSVGAGEYKFSSSGREDVDVRCLGNGRPFVIEFLNPCRTKFTQTEVTQMQREINKSSKLIHLRYLQIVDKKEVKNLKEGEEEKTKAYCALCIAREGYDPKALERLSEMKDLVLQQKTPLRVLHRRPLLVRPRVIHEIRASRVNDYFFKVHLTTQAGTYIKEFVHGDLGRTTPNLKTILGIDADIIALDVERVALEWPPKCGDCP